ncbi:unnamed protein product, partial [marine sediment metagenome]
TRILSWQTSFVSGISLLALLTGDLGSQQNIRPVRSMIQAFEGILHSSRLFSKSAGYFANMDTVFLELMLFDWEDVYSTKVCEMRLKDKNV